MLHVSIIERDASFRASLAILINGADGFHCASSHADLHTAMGDIPRHTPDVVVMDVSMPEDDCIRCIHELKETLPGMQVLVLTSQSDSTTVFRCLAAGATGYLLRRTPPDQILHAINEIHEGGAPMSSQIARIVVEHFRQNGGTSPDTASLSHREEEILAHLVQGRSDRDIADTLCISLETVHSHLHHIYRKLHVRTRTQAVVRYLSSAQNPDTWHPLSIHHRNR